MFCGAFTCHCFYCSMVQNGCKRDTPEKCKECPFDFVCSQPKLEMD